MTKLNIAKLLPINYFTFSKWTHNGILIETPENFRKLSQNELQMYIDDCIGKCNDRLSTVNYRRTKHIKEAKERYESNKSL